MEPKSGGKKNKILIIVLAILVVTIVGLIVGVIIAANTDTPSAYDNFVEVVEASEGNFDNVDNGIKAFVVSENIKTKLRENPNYNIDNALQEFESIINATDGGVKAELSKKYADFILSNNVDPNKSLSVLLEVSGLIDEYDSAYYDILARTYLAMGDEAQYEKYTNKIDAIDQRIENERQLRIENLQDE